MTTLDTLPPELTRLIIIACKDPIVFRLSKHIYSLVDEAYWKLYAATVSNNEYPPKDYTQDPRLTNYKGITSWKLYAKARKRHNLYIGNHSMGATRRILVIPN